MASAIHSKDKQITYLKDRIEQLVARDGIRVDNETHLDLVSMMKNYSKAMEINVPNPFMKIFWEQQLKATTLNSTRQMRWHPAIIQWCLYWVCTTVPVVAIRRCETLVCFIYQPSEL